MANPTDRPQFSDSELSLLQDVAGQAATVPQPFRVLWQADSTVSDSPCLTMGFPHPDETVQTGGLFDRFVWWPNGLCTQRRVALVSSRVGARKHELAWWFDLLRTASLRVCSDSECLMCVRGTTTHEALFRSTELFGIPRLDVMVNDTTMNRKQLRNLLQRQLLIEGLSSQHDYSAWKAEVLPRLGDGSATASSPSQRDQLNIQLAQRSYVLSIRDGGHLHCLLKNRLDAESAPLVLLADGQPANAETHKELLDLGAVAWLVDGISPGGVPASGSSDNSPHGNEPVGPLAAPADWLCHWTRPCAGEWPDQSRSEYLDELILGCPTKDRSALASLLRIVSHRKILATQIRGKAFAVSLTEVPLNSFRSRRVYRRHRRRYDFEPWGIAVQRSVLKKLGACPVQYGSAEFEESEHSENTVWYQPATDQSGKIDWREEREWRLPANLQLDDLPGSSVCVFVNSQDEVDVVRSVCDWRVIVVPTLPKDNAQPGS